MSCIYNDFAGLCYFAEVGKCDNAFPNGMGYDAFGHCVVEDDPNPEDSCSSFERPTCEEEEEDGY